MAQPPAKAATDESTELMKERIVAGFNKLRKEQRFYAIKIQEFESDIKEHKLVIDALKDINDEKRGCYRLVGGVLVGRTVAEILPSLEKNIEKIKELKEQFKKHETEKGKEINEYMQKFSIRFVEEPTKRPAEQVAGSDEKEASSSKAQSAGTVLVGQ